MNRTAFRSLAAVVAAGIVLTSSPAYAGPAPKASKIVRPVTISQWVTFARDAAAGVTTPLVDPPGGGCAWDVRGNVAAGYLDHALTTTEASYSSSVVCTTTAPGQYMSALFNRASLYLNTKIIDNGPDDACANCVAASSSGHKICTGQAQCAGSYVFGTVAEMKLPAGWSWSSPVPNGCQLTAANVMRCTTTTNAVPVSATH